MAFPAIKTEICQAMIRVISRVEIIDMTSDVYWLALFTLAGLAVASLRFKKSLD